MVRACPLAAVVVVVVEEAEVVRDIFATAENTCARLVPEECLRAGDDACVVLRCDGPLHCLPSRTLSIGAVALPDPGLPFVTVFRFPVTGQTLSTPQSRIQLSIYKYTAFPSSQSA